MKKINLLMMFVLLSAFSIAKGQEAASVETSTPNHLLRVHGGFLSGSCSNNSDYSEATSSGWFGSCTYDSFVTDKSKFFVGIGFNYGNVDIDNLSKDNPSANLYTLGLRTGVVPYSNDFCSFLFAFEFGGGFMQSKNTVDGHYYHTSPSLMLGAEFAIIYKVSDNIGIDFTYKPMILGDRTIQHGDEAAVGNKNVMINPQQIGIGVVYSF